MVDDQKLKNFDLSWEKNYGIKYTKTIDVFEQIDI